MSNRVGSKTVRALEVILVEKLILNQFYEINICQVMIFEFYIVYNKYEMIKIGKSNQRKIYIHQ